MIVHFPPDYMPGERRPAILWAYPSEFSNADVAAQVDGSPNRFVSFRGTSELAFLLNGYVVLAGASVPLVSDAKTGNSTYLKQVKASINAAIQTAVAMGAIDPSRVGIVGVSYGASMAVTLLAQSELFRAGIAISGAYNRSLTPFGFQRERRTLWQDRELYISMSPLFFADKVRAPLLIIHGEIDENPGTPGLQAEMMFHAITGNGGTCRLVLLPAEGHHIAARESIDHVMWEMQEWFHRFLKARDV